MVIPIWRKVDDDPNVETFAAGVFDALNVAEVKLKAGELPPKRGDAEFLLEVSASFAPEIPGDWFGFFVFLSDRSRTSGVMSNVAGF